MHPFVGTVQELLTPSQLQELIKKFAVIQSYYFLRWNHKVSGFIQEQPSDKDFPMLEGQMFNYTQELRWKYQHSNLYNVLLLTIAGKNSDFTPVGDGWKIEPSDKKSFPDYCYPAYGYRHSETRYSKEFIYPENFDVKSEDDKPKNIKSKDTQLEESKSDENKISLGQRYFIDSKTSAVQFVALTLKG